MKERACVRACKHRWVLIYLRVRMHAYMNAPGVWQALMPEDFEGEEEEIPPPMLEEGEEEPPEQLAEREARNAEIRQLCAEREARKASRRTPKELAPLLTGLLVAALFPQIIMVKTEEVVTSKKKKKPAAQPPKFFIREHGSNEPVQVFSRCLHVARDACLREHALSEGLQLGLRVFVRASVRVFTASVGDRCLSTRPR